jgi:hypothetical protein
LFVVTSVILCGFPEALFPVLHLAVLGIGGVIIANKMEQAVDEEKENFVAEAPRELVGLDAEFVGDSPVVLFALEELLGVLHADDDVSECEDVVVEFAWDIWLVQRKGENVGGLVLLAPLMVEALDMFVVGQDDRQLRVS